MNLKQIICTALVFGVIFTSAFTASTHAAEGHNVSKIELNEKTLDITKEDEKSFELFADDLASKLKNANKNDYERIIANAYSDGSNVIARKVKDKIKKVSTEDISKININTSKKLINDNSKSYNMGSDSVIITPTYVVVDELVLDKDTILKAKAKKKKTKSVSATNKKSAYGLLGNRLFTISLKCTFNYNGSKAWYKSGYDHYYTRGTLSIWQVSNWKGWREKSGTSYKAYCSGNFHFGFEYKGVGMIVQDLYCKNTITCNKKGSISKSRNW